MSNGLATTVRAALTSGAVEPLDALYRAITGEPCRDENALLRLHDALVAAHQAPPAMPDAIVQPGDRIQDMEMFHRERRSRILTVDRLVYKHGKPAVECGDGATRAIIRLDRIHHKKIKSGWRVLPREEG